MGSLVCQLLKMLPRKGRWVFTACLTKEHTALDRQISERGLLQHVKRILKRLDLERKVQTFRHSFISHALMKGTPEAIVRKWGGHVAQEILKLYTDIADEASQTAMQRLSEYEDANLGDEIGQGHGNANEKLEQAQIKHKCGKPNSGDSAK